MIEDSRFYVETPEGEVMEIEGPPALINVVEFLLALHPEVTEGARDTYVVSAHLLAYARAYWHARGLPLKDA